MGAGDRDRTGMASLEGWGSAIELHPRDRVVVGWTTPRARTESTGSSSRLCRAPRGVA
jgi:hypothetical protein